MQCLSNIAPLRDFFLSEEYKSSLNTDAWTFEDVALLLLQSCVRTVQCVLLVAVAPCLR